MTDGNLNESSSRRKAAAVNAHWSDHDKSAIPLISTSIFLSLMCQFEGLFLVLLSQYGDDFKRIAASMPHKVISSVDHMGNISNPCDQTTIQVSNYYKSNAADLELDKIVAIAPKRSPTPETASDAWVESSRLPGSGIMTPDMGTVVTATDSLSYTDGDRQFAPNDHAVAKQKVRDILNGRRTPTTFTSTSSGSFSRTFQRHSDHTEPTPQLGNTPDPAEQHCSQKPMHFTRFVTSGSSATGSLTNRDFPPTAPSSTFSFTSYSESSYKAPQANRPMSIVFYEQTGTQGASVRTQPTGENSHRHAYAGPGHYGPNSGPLPHITTPRFHPDSQSQWNRPPNSTLSSEYTSQSGYFIP